MSWTGGEVTMCPYNFTPVHDTTQHCTFLCELLFKGVLTPVASLPVLTPVTSSLPVLTPVTSPVLTPLTSSLCVPSLHNHAYHFTSVSLFRGGVPMCLPYREFILKRNTRSHPCNSSVSLQERREVAFR